MFDTLLYSIIAVVLAAAGLYLWLRIELEFKRSRQRNLADRMIKAAENYRRWFVLNIDHDIIAICTSAVFTKGLHEHSQKVRRGELKEWEKVVVYAQPTFTFAGSEQTRRPIHTGVRENLAPIVKPMILALTGIDPDKVSNKDYEKVLFIIFERDSRLFVPYAGSPSDGEKQFAFYGKTTIGQAITDINRAIGL